jgi:hypothetical protein
MIGFDRENARRGLGERLVGKERRSALVGGDSNVFEDECAEEEILVAGVRVERLSGADQPGGARSRREGAVGIRADIDRRLGDR